MTVYNYKRVSTSKQHNEQQLHGVPCDVEVEEKISGKRGVYREKYEDMIMRLHPGDVVNVQSLDRFARSIRDILEQRERICIEKQCTLHIFRENYIFTPECKMDATQKLILTILGSVAEYERDLLLARQEAAYDAIRECRRSVKSNKNNRIYTYAQQDVVISEVLDLIKSGEPVVLDRLSRKHGMSARTIRDWLKKRGIGIKRSLSYSIVKSS